MNWKQYQPSRFKQQEYQISDNFKEPFKIVMPKINLLYLFASPRHLQPHTIE